jgi:CRP-like cAMP-binding protein
MSQKILPNSTNINFVKNIFLFTGLSEAEKEALCASASVSTYHKKEFLYRQGDPISRFYIICNGAVRLFQETPEGRDVTNHIRVAGDVINSTGAFLPGEGIHTVDAMAVTDSTILDFPIVWLKNAVQQYSLVALNLLSALSQRNYALEVEVKNQSRMSSQQLLACFLTKLCAVEGLNPKGFKLPYSKALVASRLRTTQETVSRTIPKLEECGITVKGTRVSFDDLAKLEQNLCSHCPGAEKCYARKTLQKCTHK